MLLLTAVILAYGSLLFQFYQQDEWHHFGVEYVWHNVGFSTYIIKDVLSPFGVRFLPFAQLANYFQFSLFGQSSLGYGLVSLLLHSINTVLVYIVISKLMGVKRIGFLTALFFGTTPVSQQAATWLIQHTGTLPALTFSLLSTYFFLGYFEKRKIRNLFFSAVFILLAIGFKEIALYIFPFLLFLVFIKERQKAFTRQNIKSILMIFVTGLIYVLVVGTLFLTQPRENSAVFVPKVGLVQTISRRLISIPLRSVTQSFVSESTLVFLTKEVVKLPFVIKDNLRIGTPDYDIYLEQVVTKRLMYVIAVVILMVAGVIFQVVRKNKKHRNAQNIIALGIAFIIFGSFPLLFISTLAGNFVYLESRYLYVIAVGSSLLLALVFNYLLERFGRIAWIVVVIFLAGNIYQVNNILGSQIELGQRRKDILLDIRGRRPDLPQKVVFYTESDRTYYGLPATEKIMPFQSGFGETLMIWYQPTENFPVEYYKSNFLWDITDQSYKEVEGRGFGYFRDFSLLKKTMDSYKLPPESIIAFRYDSLAHTLVDITDEVRLKINTNDKTK